MRSIVLYFFVFVGLLSSCERDAIIITDIEPQIRSYLHIAHTRTAENPKLDSVAEKIDYKAFDMLWLGGDMAHLTSKDDATMTLLDSIVDLKNSNTLWALGNHDYSDLNRINAFTKREPYYAYHKDGITFLILDTQDSFSAIVGKQKEMLNAVTDTIKESSHLVVLHHKLFWMYANKDLEPQIDSISNGKFGDCFHCINPNNFYTDVYPKLVEVKQRGIEVICIAGDLGFKAKTFDYTTPEGIQFLASGISFLESDNKALLFTHDITNKNLTWEVKLISDLE